MTKSYHVYFPDEQVHFWISIYFCKLLTANFRISNIAKDGTLEAISQWVWCTSKSITQTASKMPKTYAKGHGWERPISIKWDLIN